MHNVRYTQSCNELKVQKKKPLSFSRTYTISLVTPFNDKGYEQSYSINIAVRSHICIAKDTIWQAALPFPLESSPHVLAPAADEQFSILVPKIFATELHSI